MVLVGMCDPNIETLIPGVVVVVGMCGPNIETFILGVVLSSGLGRVMRSEH